MNQISLEQTVIAVDANEASYVHHAVGELRRQLHAVTGRAPGLRHDLDGLVRSPHTISIDVRTSANVLGPEEFVLRTEGDSGIVAAGGDSMGTNYAVMQLRQLLAESPRGWSRA